MTSACYVFDRVSDVSVVYLYVQCILQDSSSESDRQRELRKRARRLIAGARDSTSSTTEIVSADADLASAVNASVRTRSRSPRARDTSPTG